MDLGNPNNVPLRKIVQHAQAPQEEPATGGEEEPATGAGPTAAVEEAPVTGGAARLRGSALSEFQNEADVDHYVNDEDAASSAAAATVPAVPTYVSGFPVVGIDLQQFRHHESKRQKAVLILRQQSLMR